MLYWDRSEYFILHTILNYLGNVGNLALGSIAMFIVFAICGSFRTENLDVLTILSGSYIVILATLAAYSVLMAFIVLDHERELWFRSNHVLNLIRFAFTPIMAVVLYYF